MQTSLAVVQNQRPGGGLAMVIQTCWVFAKDERAMAFAVSLTGTVQGS